MTTNLVGRRKFLGILGAIPLAGMLAFRKPKPIKIYWHETEGFAVLDPSSMGTVSRALKNHSWDNYSNTRLVERI